MKLLKSWHIYLDTGRILYEIYFTEQCEHQENIGLCQAWATSFNRGSPLDFKGSSGVVCQSRANFCRFVAPDKTILILTNYCRITAKVHEDEFEVILWIGHHFKFIDDNQQCFFSAGAVRNGVPVPFFSH